MPDPTNPTNRSQPDRLPAERPASLWRRGDFMKLWVAQTVSLFGSALSRLAVPFLAATTLGAGAVEMGVLEAAESAPALIVGLLAGVWVDRYRRRNFLIAGDLGRALLLATIPITAFAGLLTMGQLYAVNFAAGALGVFFTVAHRSYLPALVERSRLVEGNSKLRLSGSVTAVAGPSLAGLVIQALGAAAAVALDALTFAASALLVGLIRRREAALPAPQAPLLAQLREGFGVVLGSPWLRPLAACLATSNFASNMFFALYILFGTRELGLDAAALGLAYGIGATGALAGALVAPQAAARLGIGPAIIAGALVGSLEVVPAALATPALALPLLVLSSWLGNFGWVVYGVNEASVRQVLVPAGLQGRMNATLTFLVAGMLPLGALAGGALGELLGLRATIALAAAGSALAFLWVLFSPLRGLARLPDEPVSDL
jgi:hypothetical protein